MTPVPLAPQTAPAPAGRLATPTAGSGDPTLVFALAGDSPIAAGTPPTPPPPRSQGDPIEEALLDIDPGIHGPLAASLPLAGPLEATPVDPMGTVATGTGGLSTPAPPPTLQRAVPPATPTPLHLGPAGPTAPARNGVDALSHSGTAARPTGPSTTDPAVFAIPAPPARASTDLARSQPGRAAMQTALPSAQPDMTLQASNPDDPLATLLPMTRKADASPHVGTSPTTTPVVTLGEAIPSARPPAAAPTDAPTTVPTAAPPPPVAHAVMRLVSDGLRSVRIAEGRTRIELSPRGLGDIEVELRRDDGSRVQVVLRAESPAVLAAMRADRDGLAGLLRDSGLSITEGDLTYEGFSGHGASNGSSRERTAGHAIAAATWEEDRAAHSDEGRLPISRAATAPLPGHRALDILT